ncbi:hypothetical protein Hypma_014707 [Hypsizygus marmoreus]|uniref:F-box domain-containing protein n=1 Tax=Hypsizygus marmoreus TaxID=39966 RepID=A0A369JBK6_HYPMA|nr:hypothetical protein Hypma_014707 [Hypsizygus marmoreus]
MSTDTIPQSLRFIAILRGLSAISLSWLVQSVTQHWPGYYDVKPINVKSVWNLLNTSPVYNKFRDLIYPKSVDFPRHKFTTLPLDIVLEIVKELDWRSVLTIRRTCKYLEEISRTRIVWCSQYRRYVAQRTFPLYLEEPLESYSAAELERWVLLRISADLGWNSRDTKLTRIHRFKQKVVTGIFLVPGGRWLLAGLEDGTVLAYDLDAATITPKPLIQPKAKQHPVYYMSMSRDLSSPNLTFTLSLSPCLQSDSSPPLIVNIWRVTLVGHGATAQLTATPLKIFHAHDIGSIGMTAMLGNLLGRSMRNDEGISYIDIFDWAKSTSEAHCKATIFPNEIIDAIRFLPDGRLLACSAKSFAIYPCVIAEGLQVTAPIAIPKVTEPLWKLPFNGVRILHGALSDGYSDALATYFVVSAGNLIYGLSVPRSVDQSPHLCELMEVDGLQPGHITLAVRSEKVLIQHRDRSIYRLVFSWAARGVKDPQPFQTYSSVTWNDFPTTCNGARLPLLDEETGRIIQSARDGIVVVDTALLYMYTLDKMEELSTQ